MIKRGAIKTRAKKRKKRKEGETTVDRLIDSPMEGLERGDK